MKIGCVGFLGDSFTWGEGLQLYLDNEFWIKERSNRNIWTDLQPKCTPESESFRENNRFANLVAKHFSSHLIIDHRNGGSFTSFSDVLDVLLKKRYHPNFNIFGKLPNVLVIQFSSLNRNPIHWHLGSNKYKCYCELCYPYSDKTNNPSTRGIFITFGHVAEIYFENIDHILTKEEQNKIKEWVEANSEMRFDAFDKNLYNFSTLKLENEYSKLHFEYLINNYLIPLKKNGVETYFIDSWDSFSTEPIFNNEYIAKRMIPLIGYDNKKYLQYSKWELSFPHKRIGNEFPKTDNGHPTLLQHQYIAKSVIEYIEKNYNPIIF